MQVCWVDCLWTVPAEVWGRLQWAMLFVRSMGGALSKQGAVRTGLPTAVRPHCGWQPAGACQLPVSSQPSGRLPYSAFDVLIVLACGHCSPVLVSVSVILKLV